LPEDQNSSVEKTCRGRKKRKGRKGAIKKKKKMGCEHAKKKPLKERIGQITRHSKKKVGGSL